MPDVRGEVRHKDRCRCPVRTSLSWPSRNVRSWPPGRRSTRTAVPGPATRPDRAGRRGRRDERGDRPAGRGRRGHRPQVAQPVRRRTRLAGLRDAPRPGRPRRLPVAVRAEVIALACAVAGRPAGCRCPGGAAPELARELARRCQVRVSSSTVHRWLTDDALQPWRHRSWISVRDPDFAGQGRPGAGPIRPDLGRATLGAERLRDLRRREDLASRPAAAATPPWRQGRPARCGSSTTTDRRRCPGLPGGLGRAPRPGDRPLRGHHRDRTVLPAGHTGDDRPSPTRPRTGCSGSSTTAPRTAARPRSTGCSTPGRTPTWSTSPCTRPGSTRPRSTSPSCSARSSPPTTSPTSTRSVGRLAAFEIRYNAVANPSTGRFTRHDLHDLLHRLAAHEQAPRHALAA